MVIPTVIVALMHNPMFVGMGGAGLIGGLVVWFRSIPNRLWRGFLHLFSVDVDIRSDDKTFYYFALYLSQHKSMKKARTLRVVSKGTNNPYTMSNSDADWFFSPGSGSVWVMHDKRPTCITRILKEGNDGKPQESIRIRMLGRSQEPVKNFINEAKVVAEKDTRQKIYTPTSYEDWCIADTRHPRKLSTIVLADGQMERIIDDMQWFLDNEEWYFSRGIPYHRAYLLEGMPGTGKTSLIAALAGHFGKDVCILSLSAMVSDANLISAISGVPKNAIIAMEDIDCAGAPMDRDDTKVTKDKIIGTTLAGFLNALDGVQTPEGSIFIMTTNHPEKLDPAILRPGRCDVREHLGLMGKSQQERMSKLFFDQPISVDKEISPAQMQGILMRNATNREAAKNELENM